MTTRSDRRMNPANDPRYRVLTAAAEDAAVWDLPLPIRTRLREGRVIEEPPLPRADVASALEEALRAGEVCLSELGDKTFTALPLSEAIAAVRDEANWDPATALRKLSMFLTEEGRERLKELPSLLQ